MRFLPAELFKRSFVLSVTLTFLLGYVALDVSHFVFSNLAYYEQFQNDRMNGVIDLAGLGKVLLQHEETAYLTKRLNETLQNNDIDFYFLKRNGQIIASGTVNVPIDVLQERISDRLPGEMSITGDIPHVAFRYGPYQLAIGLSPQRSVYLRIIFERNRLNLLFDVLLVVLMASAIAFFYFKDILRLIQALRTPGKARLDNFKPVIAEANVMLQGIRSYETHVTHLENKQGLLSRHIASALRTELNSGRMPPYQFQCTMVRTDINHYSTIYSEQPVEEFMAVINEFFSRASKVIARYNGYVTDFVGDEIIYYFKDDDHENSAVIAAAAIRDIHEIASAIHLRTQAEKSYPFTVKSAMASGNLRFGPHVNGFSLSGGAFVETVRILSQVDEKSENSVYLPSRMTSRIQTLCATEVKKTVALKGLPGVTELHRIASFTPLSQHLGRPTPESTVMLSYYRNATDVVQVLSSAASVPTEIAMAMLKSLSHVSHPFSEPKVISAYMAFVRTLESLDLEQNFLLSYAVTLSKNLIAYETYQTGLQIFLKKCLQSQDRRTVANAVEALIHFEPNHHSEALFKLLKHPDNRVVANTLIKVGMLEMGREVIASLNSMLESNQVRPMASACYAVGVLASFHRVANPRLLDTHEGFISVMNKVRKLTSHPDPMVRRQALNSQKKFINSVQAA